MQSRDRVFLALFFCSGATALVYEVLWSKFLAQMFGSTIYAQTVVLASFMGGLALGNRIFGRRADVMRQPVAVYGYLEIAIGVYAFFFPVLNNLANGLFVSVGTGIAERTFLLLLLKFVLSAGLLLGPTILMGGTLPLFAAWLQRSYTDAGRRSARFYSVNSLGAVAGSGLAGFWLVQNFGLVLALQLAAFVNVLIGSAAVLLNRWAAQQELSSKPAAKPVTAPPANVRHLRFACAMVAATGAVSMGLQVLASRSLILIFGSSLQSFAIVLMSFILGIGLGSAYIASPRRRIRSDEGTIVLLLSIAAAWVVLVVLKIEMWTDIYRIARTGLGRTEIGYVYDQLLAAGISLLVLGFPAGCIGAVLPLMIRALAGEGVPLGSKTGALLTWNTLGAVGGTLLTGFWLMPSVGLRNAFGLLALTLAMVALLVAWRRRWRAGMAGAGFVLVLACSLFVFGREDWQHVISSGVFRLRERTFDPTLMADRKEHTEILFYEDGPDATVVVEQSDGVGASPGRSLRINGKTDASTIVDVGTQLLCAHLPMLAKPDAKDVFVLGLGSGTSAGALRGYPVQRIVVAENCAPVIQAAEYFEDWNRHVLEDRRTKVWREDGRTVLKLNSQLYDVIIAEPSNPWTAGVGSVFSQEFYQLAARRLKAGGVMSQWFHVYEMHDGIVAMVLRTFASVFPFVEVWDTGAGDIIMLGSFQPWPSNVEMLRQRFELENVRADMELIKIRSAEALLARQLASQRTAYAIPGEGAIQSDLFPLLEYAAPKAFYLGETSQMLSVFDERTSQILLAPPGKTEALRSLPKSTAQEVFRFFASLNEDLSLCLFGSESPAVPCIFSTNSPPPAIRPIAGTTEDDARILTEAVRALNSGNANRAREMAEAVALRNPLDAQAPFIARIAAREQSSQASLSQQELHR